MSTPASPRPGGSHRAAPPPGEASAGTPLLLPLLSALVVLGAIGLAAWMLLTSGDDAQQTDDPPQVTQPTVDPDTPTPTPTDGDGDGDGDGNGDGGQGDGDGGDKKGDDKKDGDKKGQGDGDGDKGDGNKGDGDKNDQPDGAVPQIPVYVFNQTSISGLAAQTASSLEASGWNIVGVDNWIGTVPEDTVYFYPGDRAAAERLSESARISRVWPASAPMPAGALTVILATTDRK